MTNLLDTTDLDRMHLAKHACTSHNKSDRTLRRQRKDLRDLQAQGFQTLPEFFRRKAEKAKKQDKFEAMVARVKAKLRALQDAEEQEEPGTKSKSNTETETEPEPESETETEELVWIAKSSGNTHPIEQECTVSCLISMDSDICWKPSQSIVEDEEEGSDDNQALDVKNGTKNVEEQVNPKDSQDSVLRMLKDLCRRNDPNSCSHLQPADSAMEIL